MINLRKIGSANGMRLISWLYVLIALIATLQDYFHPLKPYIPGGGLYTEYNNFMIFKYSAIHLAQGKDLYQWYPADHWDLYKYSPAFALFFSVIAYLPNLAGLFLWSLLNAWIVFFAISRLPGFEDRKKNWMLLYCVIELLGSIQNTQSNGLMAGLIMLAWIYLEKSNYFLAAFCIVFSMYIKIFGAVAFAFYLLYPNKLKMAGYTLFWILFLALIPVVITGFGPLIDLYHSWFRLLKEDHLASEGMSLAGLLNAWFKTTVSKNLILVLGVILFCLPLLKLRQYRDPVFRALLLASVLLWTIVFNHKAESPTFIISMCGIAIWYYCRDRSTTDTVLLILAFVLTTLSVSDLCPRVIREEFIKPYCIKGFMSIVIWGKIIYEMLVYSGNKASTQDKIYTPA